MSSSVIPDIKSFFAKVEQLKKSGNFDLSMEEDLAIAVMNLVSLEEHFFMTSQKTGKNSYLDLLTQTREIRKQLLSRLIDSHEGETWCISKHLLAASMRLMEVAVKLKSDKKEKQAEETFSMSYRLFSLFWGIRLNLIDVSQVKPLAANQLNSQTPASDKPWTLSDITTQLVNCCKE